MDCLMTLRNFTYCIIGFGLVKCCILQIISEINRKVIEDEMMHFGGFSIKQSNGEEECKG